MYALDSLHVDILKIDLTSLFGLLGRRPRRRLPGIEIYIRASSRQDWIWFFSLFNLENVSYLRLLLVGWMSGQKCPVTCLICVLQRLRSNSQQLRTSLTDDLVRRQYFLCWITPEGLVICTWVLEELLSPHPYPQYLEGFF